MAMRILDKDKEYWSAWPGDKRFYSRDEIRAEYFKAVAEDRIGREYLDLEDVDRMADALHDHEIIMWAPHM